MPQHKQNKNFIENPDAAIFLFGFNKNVGLNSRGSPSNNRRYNNRNNNGKDQIWDTYREQCYQDLKRNGVYVKKFDIARRSEFAYVHLGSKEEADRLKNIGNYTDPVTGEKMSRLKLAGSNVVVYPYIKDRNSQLEAAELVRQRSRPEGTSGQGQGQDQNQDRSGPSSPQSTSKSSSWAHIVSPTNSGQGTSRTDRQTSWATQMRNSESHSEAETDDNNGRTRDDSFISQDISSNANSSRPSRPISPSAHLSTQVTLVPEGQGQTESSGLDLNFGGVATTEVTNEPASNEPYNYMPPIDIPQNMPQTPQSAYNSEYGYPTNDTGANSPGQRSTARSRVASEAGDSLFNGNNTGYMTPQYTEELDADIQFQKDLNNNMADVFFNQPAEKRAAYEQSFRALWDMNSKDAFYAAVIQWNEEAMRQIQEMQAANEAWRQQQAQIQQIQLAQQQQDLVNYFASLQLVQMNRNQQVAQQNMAVQQSLQQPQQISPQQVPQNAEINQNFQNQPTLNYNVNINYSYNQGNAQNMTITPEQQNLNLSAAANILNHPKVHDLNVSKSG